MIDNVDQRSQGLRRDRPGLPARPRRLRLFRQVRRARLSRRRTGLGARDRRAGRRRRRGAQGPGRGRRMRAALVQIGPHKIDRPAGTGTRSSATRSGARTPAWSSVWEEHLETIRKAGSSTGAVVEVEATGVPAGWGAPIYGKLDAELAAALMSINAAKGVEIGEGFAAAALSGEENADEMRAGQRRSAVPVQPCRRHPGRHLHRPAGGRARGVQADLLDPHPAPLDRRGRRGDRTAHQGPPRSLRRHPRRARGRGDGRLRPRRRLPAPSRADRGSTHGVGHFGHVRGSGA